MKIKVSIGDLHLEAKSMKELSEKMSFTPTEKKVNELTDEEEARKREFLKRVSKLKKRLKDHDWSYHYSDQSSVYNAGKKDSEEIVALARELRLSNYLTKWLDVNNRQL